MRTRSRCAECGKYDSRWPIVITRPFHLIWPLLTLAAIVGLFFAISAIVRQSNQDELRKQYLLSKMSPSWETMYYVLQKVELNQRGAVMTEFIGRAPQFFEGQDLSPEQMDLFLGLFSQQSVPDVLSHINPTVIKKQD